MRVEGLKLIRTRRTEDRAGKNGLNAIQTQRGARGQKRESASQDIPEVIDMR
jgi:hypothetical protein